MKRDKGFNLMLIIMVFSLLFGFSGCKKEVVSNVFEQDLVVSSLPSLPDELGLAGAYAGVHDDALIFAGGANFPEPIFDPDTKKVYHDSIYVLLKEKANNEVSYRWILSDVKLDLPRGYGASVATSEGIICMGGNNNESTFLDVFLLSWNKEKQSVEKKSLPSLPHAVTMNSAVTTSFDYEKAIVYLIGGGYTENITDTAAFFLKLDLSKVEPKWEGVQTLNVDGSPLDGILPGEPRMLAPVAWQNDGKENCLFVFSGRRDAPLDDKGETLTGSDYPYGIKFLLDSWKYVPSQNKWIQLDDTPACFMAGAAWTWGLSSIFILSGADGEYLTKIALGEMTQAKHPGFKKIGYSYNAIGDTWCVVNDLPVNYVHIPPVKWGSGANSPIILVSGEVGPRVRGNEIYSITLKTETKPFGAINFSIIVVYLIGMLGVGVYFYFKNRNVDDFFKGGGKIPFWVAAFSLFATMLSSITFIAIPGKAYASDWTNFLLAVSILVVTPIVIRFFLPFFRQIKSASAYEYLEKRFNLTSRLFAGGIFMVYHILRMGIVLYLPALALASIIKITPDPTLNMVYAILIMGLLSVAYCSLGGLAAVVWTDTIQSFVLLAGAILTVVLIVVAVGGPGVFMATANAAGKFDLAVPSFSLDSFRHPVLWVVLLGGFGQNLIPYVSDQSIIQRYMSVKNMTEAKKSIWTNAILSLVASALFFLVGTALFVFYKSFPGSLDASVTKVDEIFPLFIVQELPIGIAGIVVAAILAAAQSTVSTSINSATAVLISDYVLRFSKKKSEKRDLMLSRAGTLVFGLLGTGFALFLVKLQNTSLWDSFLSMLGLVLGALCGLFLLGIFFKRANGPGAMVGVLFGIGMTLVFQKMGVHPYLFGLVNLTFSTLFGWIFSLLFRLIGISGECSADKMGEKGTAGTLRRWFYTEDGNLFRFSYAGIKDSKKKK